MGERRGAYRVLVGKLSDKTTWQAETYREMYYNTSLKNRMERINLAHERVNVGVSRFIRSRLRSYGSNNVGAIVRGK